MSISATSASTSSSRKMTRAELDRKYNQEIRKLDEQLKEAEKGIFRQNAQGQQEMVQRNGYVVEDGENDGIISTEAKIKNLGKGILNTFTGMFTDENGQLSLEKTLTTAVIGLGCAALTAVFPPAGGLLMAAGLGIGGIGLIKNAEKASNAKTDQEAEQAWQGIGTSGTIAAMSYFGLKSKGGGSFTEGLKSIGSDFEAASSAIKADSLGGYIKSNAAQNMFGKTSWADVESMTTKDKLLTVGSRAKTGLFGTSNAGSTTTSSTSTGIIGRFTGAVKSGVSGLAGKTWSVVSNPVVQETAAFTYATSDDPTLATYSEAECTQLYDQFEEEVATAKSQLRQNYEKLLKEVEKNEETESSNKWVRRYRR